MKVVIIGANRGIGFELAKQYREKGYDVVATCRKTNDALKSLKVTVVEGIDTAEDSLVESLSAKIPFETIDILIHSSGILQSDRFPEIDLDNMTETELISLANRSYDLYEASMRLVRKLRKNRYDLAKKMDKIENDWGMI